MVGCKEIEEVPGLDYRDLNKLEDLNLSGWPNSVVTVLPFVSVEELQGGRRLLDSTIHNCIMPRLKWLDLSMTRITEISFGEGVCIMPILNQLDLSKTRITEISFGEGVFPVLQRLDQSDCDDLVEVGASPITLTILDLSRCRALKKITGLRGLSNLQYLYMTRCCAIAEMPGLETLSLQFFQSPESEDKGVRILADVSNREAMETFLIRAQAISDLDASRQFEQFFD